MDILNPPLSYKKFRIATYRKSGDELQEAIKKFYKQNPGTEEEIKEFFRYIDKLRQEMALPKKMLQCIDGSKIEAMLYDIEYYDDNGTIKEKRIYVFEQMCNKIDNVPNIVHDDIPEF